MVINASGAEDYHAVAHLSKLEQRYEDLYIANPCNTGMSSRSSVFSKIDLAGDSNAQGGASFASREDDQRPSATKSTKQGLIRRLGSLLYPKKKVKSGSKTLFLPATQHVGDTTTAAATPATKDELELLFAQAEATLGELLVKAGASFGSSRSIAHDHDRARTNGGVDGAVDPERSSNRDTASARLQGMPAGPAGHARRNSSLSRVWQQLGGTLFCGGSQTVNMDDVRMAPLPAQEPSFYGDGCDELADESYWRSLAESILMDRQKLADKDLQAVQLTNDAEEGTHNKDAVIEIDVASTTSQQPQMCSVNGLEQDMSYQTCSSPSEIVPSETVISEGIRVSAFNTDDEDEQCSWRSLDDPLQTQVLIHVDGDGSTRLNTMLDASPVLVQNYQLLKKKNMSEGSSSRSRNVLDQQRPVELAKTEAASTRSGAFGSNTAVHIMEDVQPLQTFLWEARTAGNSNRDDEAAAPPQTEAAVCADGNSSSEQQASASAAANVDAANCRVSLLTLLHEEAAGIESPGVQLAAEGEDSDAGQVVDRRREEELANLIGEEPLALFCCVCMVRRKGAALIPCGHTFCRICSKQLFAGRGACPLCNNLIVQLLDIF